MRYEDWDILLFPRDCKVPLKEFKVACHVIQDNELSHLHGSPGLPTVCCFVPSLAPGAPYKLSIHSWSTPPISQFTRSYGKYTDRVVFEARLFVDGQLVSSSTMNRAGPWPSVLKSPFNFADDGNLDSLKFPNFRRELLNHSYWSPADSLGRIKVVISESCPRDSPSLPLERLKNVIAFSFQHAPLDILESSAIAWPNASMWRCMPFTASTMSSSAHKDDSGSHAHSPRPRIDGLPTSLPSMSDPLGSVLQTKHRDTKATGVDFKESLPTTTAANIDPFVEANAYFEWLSGIGMGMDTETNTGEAANPSLSNRLGRKSSTDTSMPDYLSSTQTPPLIDNLDGHTDRLDEDADGAHMKVPTNTPTTRGFSGAETGGIPFPIFSNDASSASFAGSANCSFLSHSSATSPQLVPTPATEVKSRKENKHRQMRTPPSASTNETIGADTVSIRKVSQQLRKATTTALPGHSPASNSPQRQSSNTSCTPFEKSSKRLRNFTPSSAKAFDDDEEPRRASPRVKLSAFDHTDS